ncbi:four helix bundle protein [Candidatus Microgenomates bacterium]|nr:four helix bundle protein [Candidatus Microgenomates bacterium]
MANEIKTRDIHNRIYKFVLGVLQIVKFVPNTPENLVMIRQVIRSSGSIGANASEADGAESKKEFIHRFTISKKEAKETHYWLSLLSDHNLSLKTRFEPVLDENQQIIAIISKIVINAKKN